MVGGTGMDIFHVNKGCVYLPIYMMALWLVAVHTTKLPLSAVLGSNRGTQQKAGNMIRFFSDHVCSARQFSLSRGE